MTLTTSGEDTNKSFRPQTSGSIYAGALINVSASQATGDYFFHLFQSSSLLYARVFVKKDPTTTNYFIGIAKSNGTVTYTATSAFTPGTTHLVIVKYTFNSGTATDDTVSLFIDPTLGGAEPTPSLSAVLDGTVTDATSLIAVGLRQGSASAAPSVQVDNIRVAKLWAGLTGIYAPITGYADFNGDGRTDFAITRASANHQLRWYSLFSGTNTGFEVDWGLDSDQVTPGDFDGDGKDDVVIWRPEAGNSGFYIIQSSTITFRFIRFGLENDDPSVVADYDGDGIDDPAIYRPGENPGDQAYFWWRGSSGVAAGHDIPIAVGSGPEGTGGPSGTEGDTPVPGDFTGDGKADFCVYRNNNSNNLFFIHPGTGTVDAPGADYYAYWGVFGDQAVPGDYDGDGKTDIAVTRHELGYLVWYIQYSSGIPSTRTAWGLSAHDYQVQGDYDGDGKTDIAVYRERGDTIPPGFWVLGSSSGTKFTQFGLMGDLPVAVGFY